MDGIGEINIENVKQPLSIAPYSKFIRQKLDPMILEVHNKTY